MKDAKRGWATGKKILPLCGLSELGAKLFKKAEEGSREGRKEREGGGWDGKGKKGESLGGLRELGAKPVCPGEGPRWVNWTFSRFGFLAFSV